MHTQRVESTQRAASADRPERITMTRFAPTDPALAAEAVAALPEAARQVTAAVAAAVVVLTEVPANPQQVLDAYAVMRRGQAAIRAAEDQLLLRLHEAGASPTGLSNALGINRLTVERRIAAARAASA
ncbi:chromosome partitioning protein [Mycobacteroides abscessus subsp. massiliense]|uniref:hypothetical protein n=1 Tax=Mycobacteroides abscessus TaxID=36809 RepID=UPI000928AC0D|nr:hypothetical protein [Mycobacteroides abscessus]SHR63261.1 chromosome partitioning protein [Mycobacteroides abscessus subsp. abscessus]SKG49713.1 chromosome partitioning protein [Mycobacteroides abscessus subsp. massiliense]SKH01789.1 chromosome partitioning protein [Mycobacteroides abscessus subsp. massiliense]SKH98050.1 chromosome partitioning protein [Mycobacteroides abscessus subsp. massiliense]SKJ26329.1 chromosome partitioning protein [Mycobacteroides abscessus subsp. massiliense]